jgi:hypothetical protein
VRDAAHVPQLQEDAPSRAVDRVGHVSPTLYLGRRVDPGGVRVPNPLRRDLGCLGDDQAGAGPLRVVLGVQGLRHIARAGAVAGHGGHHHPVRQGEGAAGTGFEQTAVGWHENSPRAWGCLPGWASDCAGELEVARAVGLVKRGDRRCTGCRFSPSPPTESPRSLLKVYTQLP